MLKERHTNFRPSTSDGLDSKQGLVSGSTSLKRKKAVSKAPLSPHFEKIMHSSYDRPFTAVREDSLTKDDESLVILTKETVEATDDCIKNETMLLPGRDVQPSTQCEEPMPSILSKSEYGCLTTCSDTTTATVVSSSVGQQQIQNRDLISCRVLTLALESTWGDKNYIGLCGIEVTLGSSSIVAELNPHSIDASPRDLSAIGLCLAYAR